MLFGSYTDGYPSDQNANFCLTIITIPHSIFVEIFPYCIPGTFITIQQNSKFKRKYKFSVYGGKRAHVIVYIQIGRGGAQAKRYKSPCASTVISEYQNYSLANRARTR